MASQEMCINMREHDVVKGCILMSVVAANPCLLQQDAGLADAEAGTNQQQTGIRCPRCFNFISMLATTMLRPYPKQALHACKATVQSAVSTDQYVYYSADLACGLKH